VGAWLKPSRHSLARARELRASGVRVTLVVREHKRLGRDIDLPTLAEELREKGL
jgi:hypothetical protein